MACINNNKFLSICDMVSVVVPVYKAEASLGFCGDSLLNQIFSKIEIILIDDGSPDNSGAICDMYSKKDCRVKVIHKSNGGVSSARNVGIENAKGKYILFVDSDDYVEPDYVDALVKSAKMHADMGHIWCFFQTVTGYKYENRKLSFQQEKTEAELHFTRKEIMTLHEMWLDASPCNKLFLLDVIKKFNIRFDESICLGEDWVFNLNYLDCCNNENIYVINKPLYNYVRAGLNSLDNMYVNNMLQVLKKINCICGYYLEKWGVKYDQIEKFNNCCFYSYEKVMRNEFKQREVNKNIAYRRNRDLMKSADFKLAFQNRTCFVHPFYKMAYCLHSYRFVKIIERVSEILYRIKLKINN